MSFLPPENKCWLYNKEKVEQFLAEGRIGFRTNTGTPFLKRYLSEVRQGSTLPTILESHGFSQDSAKETRDIFNSDVFEFPKPLKLLRTILTSGIIGGDIILDFFAGSCTTAHAVFDLNKEDGGNRKFIMIQLPEPCDKNSEAFKAGYKTIAEIGKERIRRAIKKIKEESPEYKGDLGFKVFKLDSTNIKPWDVDEDNLQTILEDYISNIKDGRSENDVLYEILLKYGLDLTLPVEERKIAGKTVFVIGAGALIICLDDDITLDVVEGIVKLKEELQPEIVRVVFKDLGFKGDVVKTNTLQTLKLAGIDDVKSI